jgi:hypothetical protein
MLMEVEVDVRQKTLRSFSIFAVEGVRCNRLSWMFVGRGSDARMVESEGAEVMNERRLTMRCDVHSREWIDALTVSPERGVIYPQAHPSICSCGNSVSRRVNAREKRNTNANSTE